MSTGNRADYAVLSELIPLVYDSSGCMQVTRIQLRMS